MIHTKAIVLSHLKFQETSLIVRCYTLEGVRSYLLKGVLVPKKKAITPAYFEPLSQLELITTERNDGTLEYIKEVKINYPYKKLHQSVIRSSVLFFLAEIGSSVLKEEHPNLPLFSFWEESLQWYDQAESFTNFHLKRIRFYFQYAHLNMYLFGGKGYKLMPQYPINPATFQMGLSWTFYN